MPLLKFDIVKGRTADQVQSMLDAAHRAMLRAFEVPGRDRYQIVTEHEASHLVIEDTGLGIKRSSNVIVLTVVTRPRSVASKQKFYEELARELEANCGISPNDLVVSMITNTSEDWSFGLGRAQFLTGEL